LGVWLGRGKSLGYGEWLGKEKSLVED